MPDLDTLNGLTEEEFVSPLGGLFEDSPWVVREAWARRPFADRAALHRVCMDVVLESGTARQLALIRAHPNLAGKAALAGDLTEASAREQAGAGLDRLSPEDYARFHRLNDAYRAKFGFPFIICVRRQNRPSILAEFERRLAADSGREIHAALEEIGQIAWLRLNDLVLEPADE